MKKWNPTHTVGAAISHKFNFTLAFNKEANHCWYVDIPYPLDHANLQMVAGADDFLDALDRGTGRVEVQFCDHPFDGMEHEWHATPEPESYGCTYDVTSPLYQGRAWLCPVTLYVLGHFPKHIYIRQIA